MKSKNSSNASISSSCCPSKQRRFDPIMHPALLIIISAILANIIWTDAPQWLHHFAHTIIEFGSKMWWGVAIGLIFVGLMNKIPREYFRAALGKGDSFGGLIRAAVAGLFLDLCSHGILMVGAKLYERGASVPQIMTFLIASPWNSLSLTIILVSLIGLKWTLLFIAGSVVIAVLSGMVFAAITKRGIIPENPNATELDENFDMLADAKARLKTFRPTLRFFYELVTDGKHEAKMLIRWLLFGLVIAASVRAFVPAEIFTQFFGPTMIGLALTLVATTIIEICSEGSAPIASDLLTRAGAPGNSFTFLMAGVSTDYTEIMVLKEATKSWKTALALPIITVPQVLVLGYIMNIMQ